MTEERIDRIEEALNKIVVDTIKAKSSREIFRQARNEAEAGRIVPDSDDEGVDLEALGRNAKPFLTAEESLFQKELRLLLKKLENCDSWELNEMTEKFRKQKENDEKFAIRMKEILGAMFNKDFDRDREERIWNNLGINLENEIVE